MDKLNICLINDSFPPAIDGVANAVTNYAKIIQNGLGNSTVVTPFYPDADDSVFDFPVLRYPSIDMTKLVGYRAGLPFSAELMDSLEKRSFDIIHSHCPITSTLLARALRDRIHVPLVFTYHTKFDIDIANAVKSRVLQEEAAKILARNISACDEVWTVSRGAGENLHKLGYEGDYIIMPNGVDFPRGRVDDALIRQVTGDYDLPEGLPLFLFVGRMMWYKGIRIILDALKKLSESGRDFRMVFVGGGNDKDEIVAYCESLGLSDRVFFVAPIHDRSAIRAWYCRADLFLFPSTFDTNGLVVREAAACGLASVLVAGSSCRRGCYGRGQRLPDRRERGLNGGDAGKARRRCRDDARRGRKRAARPLHVMGGSGAPRVRALRGRDRQLPQRALPPERAAVRRVHTRSREEYGRIEP
ncbi:MAG: glycosyltransferase [Oscillospiraceae bacterium]